MLGLEQHGEIIVTRASANKWSLNKEEHLCV